MLNGNPAIRFLGAVDANTGTLIAGWNPLPSAQLATMVSSDSLLYIGGTFTSVTVGSLVTSRNRLAAIDHTGNVAPWYPVPNSTINCLMLKSDTIYVGGAFTSLGGQTRNKVASVSAVTGTPFSWAPNMAGTSATVTSIAVKDNVVYMGGAFTTIGGVSRVRLGAVDAATGALLPWDPRANSTAMHMNIVDNGVYIGGLFTTMGTGFAISRPYAAAIDATSGVVSSWIPSGVPAQAPAAMLYANNSFNVGYNTAPYFVTLTKDQSLPVSFAAISAVKQNTDVKVNWSTASEKNNNYFEVERSSDGKQFTAVSGSIRGAGNSNVALNYSFTDANAFERIEAKTIHYRIKQVDFNGDESYSSVAVVTGTKLATTFDALVYPNPSNGISNLVFTATEQGVSEIRVFNIQGKQVHAINHEVLLPGEQALVLPRLNSGVYFIQVLHNNQIRTIKLFID